MVLFSLKVQRLSAVLARKLKMSQSAMPVKRVVSTRNISEIIFIEFSHLMLSKSAY